MPTFTVLSAERGPEKDTEWGKKAGIKMRLRNGSEEFEAEWWTKATTALPAVGSTQEFEIEDGPYGKKAKRPRGGGGFSGGSRSPRDSKRIERQHSQEMALRAMELVGVGTITEDDTLTDKIKRWTDWFVADLDNAGADVGGGPEREVGVPAQPIQRSAADVSASTAQKRAMTTGLRKLGAADDVLALIVHEKAGDPPTKAGASALLDLINMEGITLDQVIEQVGITPPSDIPVDDSDLPSGERDTETIL